LAWSPSPKVDPFLVPPVLALSTRFCPVNLLSLAALVPREGHVIVNASVGTFIRGKYTAVLLIDVSPAQRPPNNHSHLRAS
jgi:hypothetical protein